MPLLLWTVAIAYLSLTPHVTVPAAAFGWDKLNHAAAYAVLAFLLTWFLCARTPQTGRLLATAWLACFVYGAVLEVLQGVMGQGREFDVGDMLANALGALAVCVIFRLVPGRASSPDEL